MLALSGNVAYVSTFRKCSHVLTFFWRCRSWPGAILVWFLMQLAVPTAVPISVPSVIHICYFSRSTSGVPHQCTIVFLLQARLRACVWSKFTVLDWCDIMCALLCSF